MSKNNNHNPNHPKKGSATKVEPIKDLKAIKRIKKLREDNPRDYCLFTVGINTAFRACELLSIKVGQVNYLRAGDELSLKQSKNKKYRAVTVNGAVVRAIDLWLKSHPCPGNDQAPLFISRKGHKAITVSTLNNMVKTWCAEVGLRGNYGSHSLRKTWGYQQRVLKGKPVPLLMSAFGHATQSQTLDYLCIQDEEIENLYLDMEL